MTLQLDLLQRDWLERACPKVLAAFNDGRTFTSDDLHPLFKDDPPAHGNWFGVAVSKIQRKHLLKVGYTPSRRTEANGRVIAQWVCK